ncbi:hypothetical protein SAMN04487911_10842 [Arenibacter nanhaiticus]|uniref:Tetratricopeptide repeat-containing protein n=1 Tax=Arenibacter nanhaiticus TaxID=558155 RepID=A0A1M6F9A9_9FLAO|nr:hypothetical protein [Arenibacter nanhaiticus]SHI94265.1 hypothetical protein SAMN04487911_10842 [Arenibacter nanhaiticus]
MNVQDFTYLLQHPDKVVTPVQTNHLEDVLAEYPYFQAARALHLKGLKNLNSFKYNNALKITAAYTADRDILFDFITSKDFLQNGIADSISGKSTSLNDTEIVSEELVQDFKESKALIASSEDEPLPRTKKDADNLLDPSLFKSKDPKIDLSIAKDKKKVEDTLEIGQPLPFTKKEKYSFGEWLQLTNQDPVTRETINPPSPNKENASQKKMNSLKTKKFELIDKFIENNPKIVPKENTTKVNIAESVTFDQNQLMTVTLAKVYLEQKKYKKAIQAYKILSLKYPEKSSFFADRIKEIEKIQHENL